MVARPPFNHALAYLLSVILAWPSYVPYLPIETAPSGFSGPRPMARHFGSGIQGRDQKASRDRAILSSLAANFEGSDSQNDFPSAPLYFSQSGFEMTSLIPLALVTGRAGSVDRPAGFPRPLHLRC